MRNMVNIFVSVSVKCIWSLLLWNLGSRSELTYWSERDFSIYKWKNRFFKMKEDNYSDGSKRQKLLKMLYRKNWDPWSGLKLPVIWRKLVKLVPRDWFSRSSGWAGCWQTAMLGTESVCIIQHHFYRLWPLVHWWWARQQHTREHDHYSGVSMTTVVCCHSVWDSCRNLPHPQRVPSAMMESGTSTTWTIILDLPHFVFNQWASYCLFLVLSPSCLSFVLYPGGIRYRKCKGKLCTAAKSSPKGTPNIMQAFYCC